MSRENWTVSCRAKIARADEHLDTLNREISSWGDSDPFVITRKSNADGSEHLFKVNYKSTPDLWRWAVLLGDALHNLRGALDHIVYALAIAQTGTNPPDNETRLAFPICSEARFFEGARSRIASLDEPTQAAIERLQPYNRLEPGKWFMPLWWLSRLHDVDKHRLSHIGTIASVPKDVAIDARPGTYHALWNVGMHVDGAIILRLILSEPDPNVYVDLKAVGGVVLRIKGERPVRPFSLYWITRHIRREVVVACRYLTCFFPTELPKVGGHSALLTEELAPSRKP